MSVLRRVSGACVVPAQAGPTECPASSLAVPPPALVPAGLAFQRAVGVSVLVMLGVSGAGLLPPISFLVYSCPTVTDGRVSGLARAAGAGALLCLSATLKQAQEWRGQRTEGARQGFRGGQKPIFRAPAVEVCAMLRGDEEVGTGIRASSPSVSSGWAAGQVGGAFQCEG